MNTSIAKTWSCSAGEHTVELIREYVKKNATWEWILRRDAEMTESSYITRLRKKQSMWTGRTIPGEATLDTILSTFLTDLGISSQPNTDHGIE